MILPIFKKTILSFLFCVLITFASPPHAADLTDAQICRAGISTVWNVEFKDVTVDKVQKNIIHVSFPPKSKGTSSAFKCVVNGDKIVWGTTFGNWRDTDLDSVIDYETKDGIVFVRERHNNGSIFLKKFPLKELTDKK